MNAMAPFSPISLPLGPSRELCRQELAPLFYKCNFGIPW